MHFLTQEIVALIMSPLICVIRKGHLREVTETDNNRKIPESQALMKNTFKYVLLILIVLGITRIASAQETRWMPDLSLRQAVREKLNLPQNTPLTVFHLEDLYDLVVLESDIASLRGLEHAVNLHFLHLSDSRITDLTPLAELFSLETLKLYGNRISNITPLTKLTALRELGLESNRISDITPLSNLTALKALHLHNNQITDLNALNAVNELGRAVYHWKSYYGF